VQVEKDEVGLLIPDNLQGLLPVSGDEQFDLDPPEEGLGYLQEHLDVVYKENFLAHLFLLNLKG
jgi:hypothetical protein